MVGFVDLAQHCAPSIGISTLAAIVKTESGFNPLAIGINVKKNTPKPKIASPKTTDDAIATAKWLLAQGYNIDMGLGQINSSNLSGLGLTVDDMFNPCTNISAAGTILKGNYKASSVNASSQQSALYGAISAYNTGDLENGIKNGYVQRVLNNVYASATNPEITVPDLLPTKSLGTNEPAVSQPQPQPRSTVLTATTAIATNESETKENAPEAKNIMVYESSETVSKAQSEILVY